MMRSGLASMTALITSSKLVMFPDVTRTASPYEE